MPAPGASKLIKLEPQAPFAWLRTVVPLTLRTSVRQTTANIVTDKQIMASLLLQFCLGCRL